MTTGLRLAAAVLFLSSATATRAADDHEMLAAQQELKLAKDHLRDAGTDYAGHRRAAMEFIDKALQEIRQGLEVSKSHRDAPYGRERKGERQPPAESDDD